MRYNQIKYDILKLSFFLLTSCFLYVASNFFVGNGLNAISLFVFALFSLYFISRLSQYFILSLYWFGLFLAAVSGFFIENNSLYLFEIQEYARLNGAITRVICFILIFLCAACLVMTLLSRINVKIFKIKLLDTLLMYLSLYFVFILSIYLIIVSILYGTPYKYGVDRFTYWVDIAPPGTAKIRYLIILYSFVLTYCFVNKVVTLKTSIFGGLLIFFSLVLQGEKFSGLFLLVFFCLVSKSVFWKSIPVYKILTISFCVLITFLAISIVNYVSIQGDVSSAIDLFLTRISVQGQMNYAIYNLVRPSDQISEFVHFFLGVGNADEYNKGIYYFMRLIAPVDVVNRRIEQGATFTVPFPENIDYFFDAIISPVIVLLLGVGVGLNSYLIVSSIRSCNFVSTFLMIFLYYYSYGAIMMGNFHKFFEVKFIFMVLLSVVFLFLSIGYRYKKRL